MTTMTAATEKHKSTVAFLARLGDSGYQALEHGRTMSPAETAFYYKEAIRHFYALEREWPLYRRLPVDPRTFVESAYFLNQAEEIYPEVMKAIVELNTGGYVEAVLSGGIGVAKTTIALITTAYQLYVLSCLLEPQALFGLQPSSELIFVFQSVTAKLSKSVDYERFQAMIAQSPYFQEHFPFDRLLKTQMRFPNRIVVKPLSGSPHAAIGQNIFGGVIDEINFMAVVENSKAVMDGSTFDQAEELYNAIVTRRKSRFMQQGKLPGMLCLVSSNRYPGEFTERKEKEAAEQLRRTGRTEIYVYHRVLWQVKPPGTYQEQTFRLFLGDIARKPRILTDGERVPVEDESLVMHVPVDFRQEFERDILAAIRDIAGRSTFALNPFIVNQDAVAACFGRRRSVLSLPDCDFDRSRPQIYVDYIERPQEPRFAHVDLGLTNDSAGVAVGWVSGFTRVRRGPEHVEVLPVLEYDLVLEVKPPRNGEIEFENIRRLFYRLREAGMNLKWITFDTFQSRDSVQILRQKNFRSDLVSVDTDFVPYEVTKTALYDGRMRLPEHQRALQEFVRLERDPKTGKIDHPPKGSKDCSDAIAGVAYGLTYRREIWVRHQIPLTEIPASLIRAPEAKQTDRRPRAVDDATPDREFGGPA
jgi:hypothetical protein